MKVILESNFGCFSKMNLPGFIYGKEFWASSDDRMTFVKLILTKNDTVSGEFRFDLNGSTLQMNFQGLERASQKVKKINYSTPLEFLTYLKDNCCKTVTVSPMSKDWIKKSDLKELKKLTHSKEKSILCI